MFTLLVDHANRALSQLRGILWLSVHGSVFSEVASAKPGAVQNSPLLAHFFGNLNAH